MISKTLEGYNSTIFAYGLTGSGKTFTMEGVKVEPKRNPQGPLFSNLDDDLYPENEDEGLTIRAIREAFRQMSQLKEKKLITVECSFLQMYNDKIFDLLNLTSKANINYSSGLALLDKNG